jgi:hypothetical protein
MGNNACRSCAITQIDGGALTLGSGAGQSATAARSARINGHRPAHADDHRSGPQPPAGAAEPDDASAPDPAKLDAERLQARAHERDRVYDGDLLGRRFRKCPAFAPAAQPWLVGGFAHRIRQRTCEDDHSEKETGMNDVDDTALPSVAERATFQAQLDALRVREKAHTREGDAIAAARRRLPMVEVDPTTTLIGRNGPVTLLEVFEGRRQLIAYLHMWYDGQPAKDQCEGCTFYNGQVRELSILHSRDVTYATLCQGPYEESVRYRDFTGWDVPSYSAQQSLDTLLAGRQIGEFHVVCYVLRGDERSPPAT